MNGGVSGKGLKTEVTAKLTITWYSPPFVKQMFLKLLAINVV